ncbi:hypothetical protein LX36DRAFT_101555 [Colletotrichum falcatum]|nr:hypothetical protein LX36DRAFT_101555 [Colletotrichum falcatum]
MIATLEMGRALGPTGGEVLPQVELTSDPKPLSCRLGRRRRNATRSGVPYVLGVEGLSSEMLCYTTFGCSHLEVWPGLPRPLCQSPAFSSLVVHRESRHRTSPLQHRILQYNLACCTVIHFHCIKS